MRAVELFCGAGGMSRGLLDAGFDVVGAYDAWPLATENYRHNIGPHVECVDLKDLISVVPKISNLEPDLLSGGPPCQDYSMAGLRREGENASLTLAFAMIVSMVRPEWFIMENVVQAAKSLAWAEASKLLRRAGYGLSESRLNASFYDVPQARRRFIVVGRLGERDGFLQSALANAAAKQPMTLRDFFERGKPVSSASRPSHQLSALPVEMQLSASHGSSMRLIQEAYSRYAADKALVENGFVYARPLRGGRGVRSIDEPIPTITRTSWERPTSRYLSSPHPADQVSAADTAILTIDQISRLQGFPANWEWIGRSKRDILQMIANAIPAPFARRIGEVVLSRHHGRSVPDIEGRFLEWLVKGGRNRASARNVKASAGRARRLLGGRTFRNVSLEVLALEGVAGFKCLAKGTKSDLRQSLRLLADFQASKQKL